MRKIERILWAYDGLKESDFALKYSELLAGKFHAQILGLHVIPYTVHVIPGYPKEIIDPMEIMDWCKKAEGSANKRFKEIKGKLGKKGVKFRAIVTKGVPYEEILYESKSDNSDLIVMGRRGHESVERDSLGSNTIKVLRESEAPVLITKYSNKKINIKNILVPVDLFANGTNVLEYAIDIAMLFKAKIHLLNIFELNNYQAYPKHFLKTLTALSVDQMQKLVAKLSPQDVEVESQVKVASNAWRGIVDFVKENDIDLIVIATHGRKGVMKFFLCSTAERVIQETPSATLALRPY